MKQTKAVGKVISYEGNEARVSVRDRHGTKRVTVKKDLVQTGGAKLQTGDCVLVPIKPE